MPQNPTGVNQLSSHTPTQAFLENLFLGQNIKQRQKEIEAANNLSQQEQILNDQAIQANEQIMAKAANQALLDAFTQEQDFRNSIALGTVPSEFEGSQGSIFDVSKMLPGQKAPMRDIEYGVSKAKNYKGEEVAVGTEEKQQRQKAVDNQLRLAQAESISKNAGQIQLERIRNEHDFYEAVRNDEFKRKYAEEVEQPHALERIAAQHTANMALESRRQAGKNLLATSGNTEEIDSYVTGVTTGQVPITSVPQKLRGTVMEAVNQAGMKVVTPKQVENLSKIVGGLDQVYRAVDRAAALFANHGNNMSAWATATFNPFSPEADAVKELEASTTQLGRISGETHGFTDRDSIRYAGQMPASWKVNEINQRKVNEILVRGGIAIRANFPGMSDEQIISIEPRADDFLRALNAAGETSKQQTEKIAQEKAAVLEAARQKILANPDILQKSGKTLEQLLEAISAKYDERKGVKK